MFERRTHTSIPSAMLSLGQRTFDYGVRNVRKVHGNAVVGLLMTIGQMLAMIMILYLMFWLFGLRSSPIRGDYMLYIMSGVFIFMAQMRAMSAVMSSDGPASSMMMHLPLNMVVSVGGAALGALYQLIIAAGAILAVYHVVFVPISIDQPVASLGAMLLGWASGIGIGMIFQATRPWWPEGVTLISTVYRRLSMIFSGKMFVANMMPGFLLPYFTWNPLFHMIDQNRGFMFLNYQPRYTNMDYAIEVTLALLLVGIVAERYTAKFASPSWSAGR